MTSVETGAKPRDPLASLPRQDRHKPKCGPVRPSKMGRKRAYVLIGVHVLIGLHFLHWGLTGESVTPVEPSEAMQTIELGKINAGFLLFTGLIASTLLFGRWFCGWACHVVALQDLSAWLLGRIGLRPRPVRSRLLVLAPWVVAGQMFAWPVVSHWLSGLGWLDWLGLPARELPGVGDWQWELMSTDLWATFPGWIMAPVTLLVVGFLIVWWLGAKGFCTYGCPYGAFFAVADRFAPMRIKVTDACDACGHCTSVCTSNVRVHEEVAKHGTIVDPGCMKCFDCVSVCPKEALYYGAALPKPFATSQQRLQARADFTWPEEIALAVIAFGAAQWTFRGAWFGEGVPLLLAVGLGVITAVLSLLGWRLLRRREVTFQHTVLKQSGRLVGSGRLVLALVVAWLLLCTHTFVVQRMHASTIATVAEPLRSSFYGSRRVEAGELRPALAKLERLLAWSLFDEPGMVEWRALLLRALGDSMPGTAEGVQFHVEAERVLLEARGDHPVLNLPESNLALANYSMDPKRQRYADAASLLQHVLAQHPDHPIALLLMQRLESLQK